VQSNYEVDQIRARFVAADVVNIECPSRAIAREEFDIDDIGGDEARHEF